MTEESGEPVAVDFNEAITKVNHRGRAQYLVVLLAATTWVANAIGFALPIFVGRSVDRVVVSCGDGAVGCTVGAHLEGNAGCDSKDTRWEFLQQGQSVVSEWSLACDRQEMRPWLGTAFFFGNLCGNLFLSPLIDRHGRVPCACVFIFLEGVFGAICALSPSFTLYLIARFGMGVAFVMAGLAAWLLSCEVTTATESSNVMIAMNSAWALGLVAIVPAALLVPLWRPLTWIHVLLSSIVGCTWLVAWRWGLDSPAWLAGRGDIEGFDRTMTAISQANGTQFNKIECKGEEQFRSYRTTTDVDTGSANPRTLMDILCAWSGACQVLAFCLAFSACSLGYYGLALNAGNIGDNLYVSSVLTALAELPGVWVAKPLMDSVLLGRRGTLFLSILLSGICCLAATTHPASSQFVVMVSIIGKTFVTTAYCVVFVHSCEAFPPQVRGVLSGVFNMVSRCAGLLIPLVVFFPHPFPYACIGIFLVIAAFPLQVLRETRVVPESAALTMSSSQFRQVKAEHEQKPVD